MLEGSGPPYAATGGTIEKPVWCAGNWDTLEMVGPREGGVAPGGVIKLEMYACTHTHNTHTHTTHTHNTHMCTQHTHAHTLHTQHTHTTHTTHTQHTHTTHTQHTHTTHTQHTHYTHMYTQHTHTLTGATAVGVANFGQGNGTIFAQNLGCFGNESSLASCLKTAANGKGCVHPQDAAAICRGERPLRSGGGWGWGGAFGEHTHMHTYTYTHMHTHMHTHTRTYTHVLCVHLYVFMLCVCVYVHVNVYTRNACTHIVHVHT